ncbi:hypothetical protein ASG25_10415 [Rhizobium sp. Leaf384]|nr:hypothetical protein ASG25_10415 [Rhizobium sp. Leaf384]KQS82638.1 hypothetical protein ASG58_04615 [Rhizobium sp. Leaf383]
MQPQAKAVVLEAASAPASANAASAARIIVVMLFPQFGNIAVFHVTPGSGSQTLLLALAELKLATENAVRPSLKRTLLLS